MLYQDLTMRLHSVGYSALNIRRDSVAERPPMVDVD
jgi:hypothetical protein